jgi:hypothetical protein
VDKINLLKLAQLHCIFDAALSKAALIRAIQLSQGSLDCYASADAGNCNRSECIWRPDCVPESTCSRKTEVSRALSGSHTLLPSR